MPSSLDDLRYTLARALRRQRLKALARDRLGEPLLFNIASLGIAAFGSFRAREAFELINRPHYAWGLLDAADSAAAAGLPGVLALEFGVAAGAGLLNMAGIAERVSAVTGVDVRVVGFDTGKGMPEHIRQKLFTKAAVSTTPGGTGLGTKIVKDAVDAHRGTIAVESDLGKGTTITIRTIGS